MNFSRTAMSSRLRVRRLGLLLCCGLVLAFPLTMISVTQVGADESSSAYWLTGNGTNATTVSGVTTLSAQTYLPSGSTATLVNWCLTINNSPVTSNVGVPGWSPGSYQDNGPATPSVFSNGCWAVPSNSSGNLAGTAQLSIDTTDWANGTYNFQFTVTDSNGVTTTSSILAVTTQNDTATTSLPTVLLSGIVESQTYSGTVPFSITALLASGQPDSISSVCVQFDNDSCFSHASGVLDTWSMKNGTHSVLVSATDSSGNMLSLPALVFDTHNSGAKILSRSVTAKISSTNSTLVIASVKVTFRYANRLTLTWSSDNSKVTEMVHKVALSSLGANTFTLSNLTAGTKYLARISASGPNGSSTESAFTIATPETPSTEGSGAANSQSTRSAYVSRCSPTLVGDFKVFDNRFNAAMTDALSLGKLTPLKLVSEAAPAYGDLVLGCADSSSSSLNSEIRSLALGLGIVGAEFKDNATPLTFAATDTRLEKLEKEIAAQI
jgi:hypothetical protein